MSTGRSIHAVPSTTPSLRRGIEDGPRLRGRTHSRALAEGRPEDPQGEGISGDWHRCRREPRAIGAVALARRGHPPRCHAPKATLRRATERRWQASFRRPGLRTRPANRLQPTPTLPPLPPFGQGGIRRRHWWLGNISLGGRRRAADLGEDLRLQFCVAAIRTLSTHAKNRLTIGRLKPSHAAGRRGWAVASHRM